MKRMHFHKAWEIFPISFQGGFQTGAEGLHPRPTLVLPTLEFRPPMPGDLADASKVAVKKTLEILDVGEGKHSAFKDHRKKSLSPPAPKGGRALPRLPY